MTNIHSKIKPESQSISKCADLRQDCRDGIFGKMDDLHMKQMDALGEIKTEIGFMKGRQSKSGNGNGSSKKDFWIPLLVNWGPPIGFILVIGFVTWLKSKGIL